MLIALIFGTAASRFFAKLRLKEQEAGHELFDEDEEVLNIINGNIRRNMLIKYAMEHENNDLENDANLDVKTKKMKIND